jgi:branched-chain amino acid transport system substrate-binding protein
VRRLVHSSIVATLLALPCLVTNTTADPLTARIAIPAPMSGPRAVVGRGVHTAAGMVAADITARADGLAIEAVFVDDTCNNSDAARVAEALAAAKFNAVIGFPCRPSAIAATTAFARTGQLLITTAAMVPPLAFKLQGPTVFHVPIAQASIGQFLSGRLSTAPPETRIAIIRDRTQQAIGLAQTIDVTLRTAGHRASAVEVFAGGDKSFAAIVTRLKAAGVTRVALLAFPVEGGLIARELVEAIPDIEIYGPDFLATSETPLIAGAVAASRLRVILPSADPLGAGAGGHQLLSRMKAQDVNASSEALVVAAALEAYGDAVQRAASLEPTLVANALRTTAGQPKYSRFTFNERGQISVPYWAVFVWGDDGHLVAQP